MSENSLRVVARIKAKPERVEEVRNLLSGLIEPTRKESGCVTYELLQNRQDPTDFTFVEEWDGDSAFENHFSTDHIQNALPQLGDLAAEEPDIRTYTVVG
jgi:quinol monooxygenase YgiN